MKDLTVLMPIVLPNPESVVMVGMREPERKRL